ncbi:MAG: hypothetical protein NWE89_05340 [Candidatus Bathyarchaeota archaeon]|nr:hypothetical protein [Candidatus Bathyarchaeota archaeon]
MKYYKTDLNSQLTLPCKRMILREDAYIECSLMPSFIKGEIRHSLCQALNPNLTTVTIKGVAKPSELSFIGSPDKENFEIKITAYESEIVSVYHPEDSLNLDDQCPAGYDWKTVNLKIDALFRQFTVDDVMNHPEKAGEINRMIKRLFLSART